MGLNWVKVRYPEQRKVYIDGELLGNTNRLKYVGEDGTYCFDLGEPRNYTPRSRTARLRGTSRKKPLILVFRRRR